jgi:hypothetical protein
MGFDTHMILETVPVPPSNARTRIRSSTGHQATLPGPCPLMRLAHDNHRTKPSVQVLTERGQQLNQAAPDPPIWSASRHPVSAS